MDDDLGKVLVGRRIVAVDGSNFCSTITLHFEDGGEAMFMANTAFGGEVTDIEVAVEGPSA